jgi:hypothetical protein
VRAHTVLSSVVAFGGWRQRVDPQRADPLTPPPLPLHHSLSAHADSFCTSLCISAPLLSSSQHIAPKQALPCPCSCCRGGCAAALCREQAAAAAAATGCWLSSCRLHSCLLCSLKGRASSCSLCLCSRAAAAAATSAGADEVHQQRPGRRAQLCNDHSMRQRPAQDVLSIDL